jgi:MarR family transcriptional regulator, transcriptional regulator for hemolysin
MLAKNINALNSRDLQLGALLADAVRLLRKDFYQRAEGLKITPALGRLLYYIARFPDSPQVDLAARMEVTPVTLSRMVDRLVKSRYVRRVSDPGDRRVYRLVLARAGQPLIGRMTELSFQTTARALRGLSKREQAKLAAQLAILCHNLSNDDV